MTNGYIRLEECRDHYTFSNGWVHRLGVRIRRYINGNNIWSWSRMPDDRESNFASSSTGAYPTMKRFNFGIKFLFNQ